MIEKRTEIKNNLKEQFSGVQKGSKKFWVSGEFHREESDESPVLSGAGYHRIGKVNREIVTLAREFDEQ